MLEHTKCRARSDLSLPCFSGYLTLHSGPRWRLETSRLALSEVSPGSKVPRVARSAPIDVGSVGRPPRTWFEIASGYGYLASLTLNAHSCLLSISISIWMRECCVVVLRRELRCQATARFKEQPLPYGCRPPDVFGLFFLFFCSQIFLIKSFLSDKKKTLLRTTLNGGSLGSCVDEERSQLRELM